MASACCWRHHRFCVASRGSLLFMVPVTASLLVRISQAKLKQRPPKGPLVLPASLALPRPQQHSTVLHPRRRAPRVPARAPRLAVPRVDETTPRNSSKYSVENARDLATALTTASG